MDCKGKENIHKIISSKGIPLGKGIVTSHLCIVQWQYPVFGIFNKHNLILK